MIKLFGLPFIAAGLMTMAWISALGGSPVIVLSGLVIFAVNFRIVLLARRRAV